MITLLIWKRHDYIGFTLKIRSINLRQCYQSGLKTEEDSQSINKKGDVMITPLIWKQHDYIGFILKKKPLICPVLLKRTREDSQSIHQSINKSGDVIITLLIWKQHDYIGFTLKKALTCIVLQKWIREDSKHSLIIICFIVLLIIFTIILLLLWQWWWQQRKTQNIEWWRWAWY